MSDWEDTVDECNGAPIAVDGNKNDMNIVKHLISSYGGISSLMSSMTGALQLLPKVGNSKVFVGIGKAVSISMVGYDLYTKIRGYYNSNTDSVQDKKRKYVDSILNKPEDYYVYRYVPHEMKITTEHLQWLTSPHNEDMGDIAIKSYYDLAEGKQYDTTPPNKTFSILVSYKEEEYLLELEMISLYGNDVMYVFKKGHTLSSECVNEFVDTLNAKYMESVGFDKNVLMYDGINIGTRPRSTAVNFDIASIDFDGITKNISNILDNKQRRGYLFVGPPGTGKTSILLKLEQELLQYPILYLMASNLADEYTISRLEVFIHNLGKCIVFIEDMDALEISIKNKRIAPILSLLDNSRRGSTVVFIATINDASLITPSVARTGRFDEIVEVKPPSTNEEIYGIMGSAYERFATGNISIFVDGIDSISKFTYFRLKRQKLTQSDYCELVQSMCLNNEIMDDKTIISAMKKLVKSKKAFKKYKEVE